MSVGFLVGADKALIWRGPLVMKAVRQLLHDVAWAPLDVLVLDLPPGTGDVQITMAQDVPVSGAVVVTTPQDVALGDAIKGVDMFNQVGAPVLGIVENMSYFTCPDCNSRHEIFGHGSVEPLAARLGVPFLGELPLDPYIRVMADQGKSREALTGEHGAPFCSGGPEYPGPPQGALSHGTGEQGTGGDRPGHGPPGAGQARGQRGAGGGQ